MPGCTIYAGEDSGLTDSGAGCAYISACIFIDFLSYILCNVSL